MAEIISTSQLFELEEKDKTVFSSKELTDLDAQVKSLPLKTDEPEPPPFDIDRFIRNDANGNPEEYAVRGKHFSAAMSFFVKPWQNLGYSAAASLNRGMAHFSEGLALIADYIAEMQEEPVVPAKNIELRGWVKKVRGFGRETSASSLRYTADIFEDAAKTYEQNREYWQKKADENGIAFMTELFGEALGGALPGIAEFILNIPFAAVSGAARAHQQGNSELAGALTEAAKRGVLGLVFRSIHPLKQYLRAPVFGGVFGIQTAAEGGDAREVAKGVGTGFIYSMFSPGGRYGLREIRANMQKEIVKQRANAPETEIIAENKPTRSDEATPKVVDELPAKGVVSHTATNRSKLSADPDWNSGKSQGDMEAARRFAARNWQDAKTEKLTEIVGGDQKNILFIAQPSTSRRNLHPLALAEKLAGDTGGAYVSGRDYAMPTHNTESKKISPAERVFNPRDYQFTNSEGLRDLARDRKVVLVDDIYTSGGSAASFIRVLQKEGIPVAAHVGYFGEARLKPDPRSVDKLQKALKNAGIPVKGGEITKLLTRSEIGGIIKSINTARSQNAKEKLTENLQGILDRRASGNVNKDAADRIAKRRTQGEDTSYGSSGERVSPDTRAPSHDKQKTESSLTQTDKDKFSSPEGGEQSVSFAPEAGFRRQPEKSQPTDEITRRSDLVRFLNEKLDIPIKTGRFRDKALGIFKIKPEVIRTQKANDIEVIAHEIGHAIHKFLYPESVGTRGLKSHPFSRIAIFSREGRRGMGRFFHCPPAGKAVSTKNAVFKC